MKKIIKMSLAAVALSAVSTAGVFAATSQTDTISVTVSDNCALSRGSTPHNNGASRGTWSSDTLSVTMTPGTVDYNIGKSNFSVVCNNNSGYKVTVTSMKDLVHSSISTLKIPAYTGASSGAGSAYSASVSGWSPIADTGTSPSASTTKYKNGDTVKTESAVTGGSTFSVYYGVGVSGTQAQGTYTASSTVTYTLAKL